MRNCAGQSLATSAATCVPRCDAGAFRQVRMRRCTRVLAWPSAGQPWRDTLRCMLLWTLLAEKPPNLVFFVMLNAGDVLLDNCFSEPCVIHRITCAVACTAAAAVAPSARAIAWVAARMVDIAAASCLHVVAAAAA
eukprot:353005-Chlamydomonas_euryale.AAC.9